VLVNFVTLLYEIGIDLFFILRMDAKKVLNFERLLSYPMIPRGYEKNLS